MIGFNAEVDNLSNRNMKGSFLNLVEVVTYRASNKSRTERRVVIFLKYFLSGCTPTCHRRPTTRACSAWRT